MWRNGCWALLCAEQLLAEELQEGVWWDVGMQALQAGVAGGLQGAVDVHAGGKQAVRGGLGLQQAGCFLAGCVVPQVVEDEEEGLAGVGLERPSTG